MKSYKLYKKLLEVFNGKKIAVVKGHKLETLEIIYKMHIGGGFTYLSEQLMSILI